MSLLSRCYRCCGRVAVPSEDVQVDAGAVGHRQSFSAGLRGSALQISCGKSRKSSFLVAVDILSSRFWICGFCGG